jgi:queuine/archaeosine tRNA-ribosyltransferase
MENMREAIENSKFDDFINKFYQLRSKPVPNVS